ncbi:hypothetical protein MTO96_011154 [Rhipicephalus appendiculatus]
MTKRSRQLSHFSSLGFQVRGPLASPTARTSRLGHFLLATATVVEMPAQRESPVEIGSLESSNSSAASEGESYALAQLDWDPTRSYDDEASPRIVLCTSLDIAELIKDPPAGMHVAPQEGRRHQGPRSGGRARGHSVRRAASSTS